jgi:hypothetical protein
MRASLLAVAAVVLAVLDSEWGASSAFAHTVTLTVRVRDHAGKPVADAPVEFGVGLDAKFAMTGVDGEVSAAFAIGDDREASARLWDGEGHTLTPKEILAATARYGELSRTTASDRLVTAAIPADAKTHSLTITLKEAVKISFRLTNPRPATHLATVMTRDSHAAASFRFTVAGVLHGVPKGAATQLLVIADTPEAWIRPLTEAETSKDTNLGDVAFPEPTCSAPVTVTMTNHTDLWASPIVQLRNMASFIKKDDGRVFLAFVNRETNQTVETEKDSVDPFKLPPGSYYVLPGCFGADIHWKAYDLIKAGRHTELDAAKVPVIVAADGPPATLTVDARKVMEALRGIR